MSTRSTSSYFARSLKLLSIVGLGIALSAVAAEKNSTINIGYQKYGTLVIVKSRHTLEKRLAPLGVDIKWIEFPGGPQLLEGLNVGSVDFGVTGEAPPIFAQAAQAPLLYVGYEPPAPEGEAILVQKNSPIKTIADLKGKRIGLNKGSNVHYLLVKSLEKAGLKYTDVEVAFLTPADGRAAFERGSIDAWVVWDPFSAAAEDQLGARILGNGKGVVSNTQFYLSSSKYANAHPDIVHAILAEVAEVDAWSKSNPKAVAEILSPDVGLPVPTLEKAIKRSGLDVKPLNATVVAQQQEIANTFFKLGLIPHAIKISDVIWNPEKK